MNTVPILSKEIDFSRINYWEHSQYFDRDVILFVSDTDKKYSYNLGKVAVKLFVPGFGDCHYQYQEIAEGFNFIAIPQLSKQAKIAIQPYSKVGKLQIKLFLTEQSTSESNLLKELESLRNLVKILL